MPFKIERSGDQFIFHGVCPGCFADDFWKHPLDKLKEVEGIPTKCNTCGRSFAIMLNQKVHPPIEIVQTGGPDLPAVYYEYYRRVS